MPILHFRSSVVSETTEDQPFNKQKFKKDLMVFYRD